MSERKEIKIESLEKRYVISVVYEYKYLQIVGVNASNLESFFINLFEKYQISTSKGINFLFVKFRLMDEFISMLIKIKLEEILQKIENEFNLIALI